METILTFKVFISVRVTSEVFDLREVLVRVRGRVRDNESRQIEEDDEKGTLEKGRKNHGSEHLLPEEN